MAPFSAYLRIAVPSVIESQDLWCDGRRPNDAGRQLKDVATKKGSLKRNGKLSVIEGEYARGDAHVDTGECAAQTRPRLQSCSGFRRSAPI